MTNSNLKTFDNFYADLAQSAYTYRPNNFPPDNNALDYQLFDFSRDNKFYNKEKKNGKPPPEEKTFLIMEKSTCNQILSCEILIKSHRYQFLMRMG